MSLRQVFSIWEGYQVFRLVPHTFTLPLQSEGGSALDGDADVTAVFVRDEKGREDSPQKHAGGIVDINAGAATFTLQKTGVISAGDLGDTSAADHSHPAFKDAGSEMSLSLKLLIIMK